MSVNPIWLAAFGSECWYCGITLTPEIATVDHRIPICRGGRRTKHNVVPACHRCNCMKGRKTEEEFLLEKPVFAQRRKFQPVILLPGAINKFHTVRASFPNRPATDGELAIILASLHRLSQTKKLDKRPPDSERRRALKDQFRRFGMKRGA